MLPVPDYAVHVMPIHGLHHMTGPTAPAGHCDPTQKEAHVQQFMWTGGKANDLGVPLNAEGDGQLRQKKAQEWSKPVDPWSTTKALDGKQVTDALAAQGSVKRESCRCALS